MIRFLKIPASGLVTAIGRYIVEAIILESGIKIITMPFDVFASGAGLFTIVFGGTVPFATPLAVAAATAGAVVDLLLTTRAAPRREKILRAGGVAIGLQLLVCRWGLKVGIVPDVVGVTLHRPSREAGGRGTRCRH